MPKGAKKRAKLKKKQQQGQGHHPDDGANHEAHGSGSGSDTNTNANNGNGAASGRRDHNLRIPTKASHHVDASEDSMESSEEMVTPRAAGSEPDEEERKAPADVPVVDAARKEVMVDALSPPEPSEQGKDGAEVQVHAVVQEPEVKDVVVDEAPPAVQEPEVAEAPPCTVQEPEPEPEPEVAEAPPAVQEPEPELEVAEAPVVEVKREVAEAPVVEVPEEVKREVAEAPVVEVPEEVKREVAKVHPVREPEPIRDDVTVRETPAPPVVPEPEVKSVNVEVKDSTEVSRSREVHVQTTEARGPAVAVASSAHRATWWNCCGLFDAFSGSER